MPIPPRRLLVLLLALGLTAVNVARLHAAPAGAGGGVRLDASGDTVAITGAQRAAGLSFDPAVAPGDRLWIEQAIAGARPEARRLIADVDGMVRIHTAPLGESVMGLTQSGPTGFDVSFNIAQLDGERAIDRDVVVLHELGHVVDFALIGSALDARLDAGIPRPATCGGTGAPTGACAVPAERIADTFAKWALGGAVSAVGAGYQIPAPPSLEDWGAPLAALAAGLPSGPS